MKNRVNNLIVAAITVAAMLGACKRVVNDGEVNLSSLPKVEIAPSINNQLPQQMAGVASRVTTSHEDTVGQFEPADSVGVFIYDEKSKLFTTQNEKYTAGADTTFKAVNEVRYASYFYHNLFAYFPYNTNVTDVKVMPTQIELDQTIPGAYTKSDFMSDTVCKITPQQLTPLAPEIPLKFSHRMTSVVVKIKNADNSALNTIPSIKVVNVFNKANFDATTQKFSTLTAKMKDGRIVDSITLRRNPAGDIKASQTLCYDGIVMPQTVSTTSALIFIQIGKGKTAFTYNYTPKANDAIVVAGGLKQGAEHVFQFTINGTEILVQGGEITPWGKGAKLDQAIGGGGISLSRMIFEIDNGDQTAAATITQATLSIDGVTRTAQVEYEKAIADKLPRLVCLFNQSTDWGQKLNGYQFKNEENTTVWTTQTLSTALPLLGNYNLPTYNTVIAKLNPTNGVIVK